MQSIIRSWLSAARLNITGDESQLSFDSLNLGSTTGNFPLLSLPSEIIDKVLASLDFQSLKSLRCSCKKLGESTSPLLFGTLRIRFRLRDLTSVREIARDERLRRYVHTMIYVGDQYATMHTFSHWKAVVGIIDHSPTPAHFRPLPAEPPPWTLDHAQWRGYRRYQQIIKEQKDLHSTRFDHDVFLEAIPRFSNLKHLYLLMQQEEWRSHSQSVEINELMHDWKPSIDAYRQWGATRPLPQLPRLSFLYPLQWLSWGNRFEHVTLGLERLVISGINWGPVEPDFDVTAAPPQLLASLKHLILDFRLRNGSFYSGMHFDWVTKALRHLISCAVSLEKLDIFHSSYQTKFKLHPTEIIHSSHGHPELTHLTLYLLTFDKEELEVFIGAHRCSLQQLIIEKPNFVDRASWKDWLLSGTQLPQRAPSPGELIEYFVNAWTASSEEDERTALREYLRANTDPEMLSEIEIRWQEQPRKEDIMVHWPVDSPFAGSIGRYNEAKDVLRVEWPNHQPFAAAD